MPNLLVIGRYRFFFYGNENDEPPHDHVTAAEHEAKFWPRPVDVEASYGFRDREIREIAQLVREHESEFVEAWNGYFGR